jgi:hypothetical protein
VFFELPLPCCFISGGRQNGKPDQTLVVSTFVKRVVEHAGILLDRMVSCLQTPSDWDYNEKPRRTPFRRLARISEGVSPGYTAIVFGKEPSAFVLTYRGVLICPGENGSWDRLYGAYARGDHVGNDFLR